MTFEVVARELGSLTTRDLHGVPLDVTSAVALVLSGRGAPFAGRVRIGEMNGGRGVHRGWVCQTCQGPKYKLFVHDEGRRLGCGACSQHLTRHQLEHVSRGWKAFGCDTEDLILRKLGARPSAVVTEQIVSAVHELMAGDRDRWAQLERRALDATIVALADDEAPLEGRGHQEEP